MAMGIPMICNSEVGDVDLVVKETNCGLVLNELNASAFDEAINHLSEVQAISPEKIRAGAFAWYSLDEGIRRYAGIYKTLLDE